jgi:hypothetical protein
MNMARNSSKGCQYPRDKNNPTVNFYSMKAEVSENIKIHLHNNPSQHFAGFQKFLPGNPTATRNIDEGFAISIFVDKKSCFHKVCILYIQH